jgi:hypothetical protein
MLDLHLTGDLGTTLLMVVAVLVWPPAWVGGFWTLIGLYAITSILFDDETPRGNPGVNTFKQP